MIGRPLLNFGGGNVGVEVYAQHHLASLGMPFVHCGAEIIQKGLTRAAVVVNRSEEGAVLVGDGVRPGTRGRWPVCRNDDRTSGATEFNP